MFQKLKRLLFSKPQEEAVKTEELRPEDVGIKTDPMPIELIRELAVREEPIEIEEEEIIEEVDVDTSFRFEVYVGDTENDVKLVNEEDFNTIQDARQFAIKFAILNDKKIFFIHEEVKMENGEKAIHRHY